MWKPFAVRQCWHWIGHTKENGLYLPRQQAWVDNVPSWRHDGWTSCGQRRPSTPRDVWRRWSVYSCDGRHLSLMSRCYCCFLVVCLCCKHIRKQDESWLNIKFTSALTLFTICETRTNTCLRWGSIIKYVSSMYDQPDEVTNLWRF